MQLGHAPRKGSCRGKTRVTAWQQAKVASSKLVAPVYIDGDEPEQCCWGTSPLYPPFLQTQHDEQSPFFAIR